MKNKIIALLVLFTVILFSSAQAQTTAHKFEAGKNTFLLDGKPFVVKAAELLIMPVKRACPWASASWSICSVNTT